MDVTVAKHHIAEANYAPVLMYDQLGQQRKAGRVFHGFHEAEIDFKPTYKYDPGTDNWDSRFFSNCIKLIYLKRNELYKVGLIRTYDFFMIQNTVRNAELRLGAIEYCGEETQLNQSVIKVTWNSKFLIINQSVQVLIPRQVHIYDMIKKGKKLKCV